jgi:hypothetical protein
VLRVADDADGVLGCGTLDQLVVPGDGRLPVARQADADDVGILRAAVPDVGDVLELEVALAQIPVDHGAVRELPVVLKREADHPLAQ